MSRFFFQAVRRLVRWYDARLTEEIKASLGSCGQDLEVCMPADIRGAAHVYCGDRVFIGPGVLIGATEVAPVRIGDAVMLGPGVRLLTGDHRTDSEAASILDAGPGPQGPITLDDGCWIGAGAIVLKGVTVGRRAVVGAGSVVTCDIGDDEIYAGNPARKLRDRVSR